MAFGKEFKAIIDEACDRLDIGQEALAEQLFRETSSPAAAHKKLARTLGGEETPRLQEARRLLRELNVSPPDQERILAPYQVSQLLTKLADRSGYTRQRLAKDARMSYNHFMRILNGTRHLPNQEKLLRLARDLGAKPSEKRDLLQLAQFDDRDLLAIELLRGEGVEDDGKTESAAPEKPDHRRLVGTLRDTLKLGVDALTTRARGMAPIQPVDDVEMDVGVGPLAITTLATQKVGQASPGEMIYISLGRHFVGEERLLQGFLRAIQDALRTGVHIKCLLPPTRGADRVFRSLTRTLDFLGLKGDYTIRYSSNVNADDPARVMIFPDQTALVFLPKEVDNGDDAAVVVQDKRKAYVRHFRRRFDTGSSFVEFFRSSESTPLQFQQALREAEGVPGIRLITRRRFTNLMIPLQFWDAWEGAQIAGTLEEKRRYVDDAADPWRFERLAFEAISDGIGRPRIGEDQSTGSSREEFLEDLKQEKILRLQRYTENLNSYLVREIYDRHSVEAFFTDRRMPAKVRCATLDQTIQWLEGFDNYAIAFADDNGLMSSTLFGVHGQSTVFMSVWNSSNVADYLKVDHPCVAHAFKHFFVEEWNAIPREWRAKKKVVDWFRTLRDQIT